MRSKRATGEEIETFGFAAGELFPHSLGAFCFTGGTPNWHYFPAEPRGLDMNREQELAVVRRAYAKQIMASVGLDNSDVEAAFATVERERYLGPGAWPVWRSTGYTPPPDDDPVYLYSDVLIGIVPERGLNNGMPSYHAPLIASAGIRPGEHVVHIGAGVGYYTAIMAHLSGTAGRKDLAARRRWLNYAPWRSLSNRTQWSRVSSQLGFRGWCLPV
jgi:hypothetical protein